MSRAPTDLSVDSLDSLKDVEASLGGIKGKVVIHITGCNPPSDAQQLMLAATVLRAKNQRKRSVKIEGFEVLQEILDRAAELAEAKAQLEEVGSETPNEPATQEHRHGYGHTTDYYAIRECVNRMDLNAMGELERDVLGNIKRFEHHRAMEEDATLVARDDWLPRVSEEYAKYRPSGSGSGSGSSP